MTLYCVSASGYSQCQISGKINDASNAAVPYAPIALMNNADSTIYKGILTDEKGNYCFNEIKAGTYIIKISVVGFAAPQKLLILSL